MAEKQLSGIKVAVLAVDGVEQVELLEPKKALEEAIEFLKLPPLTAKKN